MNGNDGRRPRAAGGAGLPVPAGLDRILGSLPDAVMICTTTGEILWAGARFVEMLHVPVASVAGRKVSLLAGPYAEQADGRALLDLVAAGDGQLETTAFVHEGMALPCLVRVRPVAGEPGLRIVTITDNADVQRLRTELVLKADAALRERSVLRGTCEVLDDGTLVVDDTERLVHANQAARQLFGIGGNESQGRSLTELPLPPAIRGAWLTFLASDRASLVQTSRVTIDGEPRAFLLRLARARTPGGMPLASMLVVRDLTRLAENDRRKYDFITRLGHELRTPLASIQGFAETLFGEPDLEPDLRREFSRILVQESQRLAGMVSDLLDLGQLDADESAPVLRPLELCGLVRDAVAGLGTDAAAARSIGLDLPDAPVRVQGDAERLAHAFRVLLRGALHSGAARSVRVVVREAEGCARVDVHEWGPAVPPEDLEQVFAPFYNTAPGRSVGTGLALCRRIVELHGGTLRAELPTGAGLLLAVTLPLL